MLSAVKIDENFLSENSVIGGSQFQLLTALVD